MNQLRPDRTATQWGRFDQAFTSTVQYLNPVQEAQFAVTFTSPTGAAHTVDGFWDGATTWRIRFMPDTEGAWSFFPAAPIRPIPGYMSAAAPFGAPRANPHALWPARQHSVTPDRRNFEHADGTPFFWLADTCWSGPLQSSAEEWEDYLRTRVRQQFNAVQWLGMQFIAAPHGDCDGQMAFAGHEQAAVNAAFFRRLDARIDALDRAGLLAVPALLWAAHWSTPAVNSTNPGFTLPESQCILLARTWWRAGAHITWPGFCPATPNIGAKTWRGSATDWSGCLRRAPPCPRDAPRGGGHGTATSSGTRHGWTSSAIRAVTPARESRWAGFPRVSRPLSGEANRRARSSTGSPTMNITWTRATGPVASTPSTCGGRSTGACWPPQRLVSPMGGHRRLGLANATARARR